MKTPEINYNDNKSPGDWEEIRLYFGGYRFRMGLLLAANFLCAIHSRKAVERFFSSGIAMKALEMFLDEDNHPKHIKEYLTESVTRLFADTPARNQEIFKIHPVPEKHIANQLIIISIEIAKHAQKIDRTSEKDAYVFAGSYGLTFLLDTDNFPVKEERINWGSLLMNLIFHTSDLMSVCENGKQNEYSQILKNIPDQQKLVDKIFSVNDEILNSRFN